MARIMPLLSFEKSDGDPSEWPEGWKSEAVPIKSNPNYYEKVPL